MNNHCLNLHFSLFRQCLPLLPWRRLQRQRWWQQWWVVNFQCSDSSFQFYQVAANPSQSRPLEQQLRGFMMENWAPMCTMMHHGNTIRGQCSTKDKEEVKFGTILNCSDMTAPGVSVSIPPIITSCGARPLLLVQSRAAASGSSVILMVWSALATSPFSAHNIFPKIFSS